MATATVALLVSVISASLTLSGLVWQFTLYRLSGARVRVELIFVYLDEDRSLHRAANSKRRRRGDIHEFAKAGEFGVEAAEVRVTNIGRSPISVDDILLDLGRELWRSRHRFSLGTTRLQDSRSRTREIAEPTDGPARLEPGAMTSRVFHIWPQLLRHIESRGGELILRGTAHAAGRRRSARSPRRYAWTLRADNPTWFTDVDVTPELNVYRRAWALSYDVTVGQAPLQNHRTVSNMLQDGDDQASIASLLNSINSDGVYLGAARQLHDAFHGSSDGTSSQ